MSDDDQKQEDKVESPSAEAAEDKETQEKAEESAEKAEEAAEPARNASQDDAGGEAKEAVAEVKEEVKEIKAEVKEEKKEEKAVKASPKLAKIIESIEDLSVLELSELVKALQDKFGVSAAPTMVAASPQGNGQAAAPEGPTEGQTTFNVILAGSGANKISVIKALREINQQLGLKEAKDIADAPPKEILSGVNKETAEEAKQKLTAAGATVELK